MDRNGLWYATAFCHTKMQSIKPAPKWSWMLSWLRASEELEDGIDTWDYFKHSRFIVNDSSVNQLCTRTISSVGDRNMSIYLGHPQWINRHMIHFEENKCQKIVDDHEPKGRHNTSVKRFQKLREYDGTCVSLLQGFCFFVYVSALLYRLFIFLTGRTAIYFGKNWAVAPVAHLAGGCIHWWNSMEHLLESALLVSFVHIKQNMSFRPTAKDWKMGGFPMMTRSSPHLHSWYL